MHLASQWMTVVTSLPKCEFNVNDYISQCSRLNRMYQTSALQVDCAETLRRNVLPIQTEHRPNS